MALKALVNHSLGNDVTSGYVIATVDRLREPVHGDLSFLGVALGQEVVEQIEVHPGPVVGEAVPAPVGEDERVPGSAPRVQGPAQHGDVALDGRRVVLRGAIRPQEVGQPLLGDAAAALEQKDLEELPGLPSAQVARTQHATVLGVDDLYRAEHADLEHSMAPARKESTALP